MPSSSRDPSIADQTAAAESVSTSGSSSSRSRSSTTTRSALSTTASSSLRTHTLFIGDAPARRCGPPRAGLSCHSPTDAAEPAATPTAGSRVRLLLADLRLGEQQRMPQPGRALLPRKAGQLDDPPDRLHPVRSHPDPPVGLVELFGRKLND